MNTGSSSQIVIGYSGKKPERRLAVVDVGGIAVVGEPAVPQAVPVGQLPEEVVMAEVALQVGGQQQQPARRQVDDGDPQQLAPGQHRQPAPRPATVLDARPAAIGVGVGDGRGSRQFEVDERG